jgi:TATA-box binding protein (TBP) (component of TFIID and TFIIIB)
MVFTILLRTNEIAPFNVFQPGRVLFAGADNVTQIHAMVQPLHHHLRRILLTTFTYQYTFSLLHLLI